MQQKTTANQNHPQHWQRSLARLGTRACQKGIALILFVMVVIIGATILFASARSPNALQLERNQITLDALRMAKEALIAYAATHPDRPGGLPCPDANNDGNPDPDPDLVTNDTDCNTTLGWLPFKALALPDLRDSSGERIWYAVSPEFQEKTAPPLNSDAATNITLNSTPDYIALVIAPQRPVSGQGARAINDSNPSGDSSEVLNYLEQANAQTPFSNFISADEDATDDIPFNDVVLGIRPVEMLPIVEQRVAGDLIKLLRAYKDSLPCSGSDLPFAAPFGNNGTQPVEEASRTEGTIPSDIWGAPCPELPNWYTAEEWYEHTSYQRCVPPSTDCLEYCKGATSCTVGSGTNATVVVIIAGRALAGQTDRNGSLPVSRDEYFENENLNTNGRFTQNNPSADYNNRNDTLRAF